MPLELRKQRDGSLRPTWYGRYEINGRLERLNLLIKIAGTPPPSGSLREEGDGAFERSRAAAQAELDDIVEEARTQKGSVRLVEKLYEMKTGEIIRSVQLANLPSEWAKIPRKRKPNKRYASQCQSTLKRFTDFAQQSNAKASEMAHVSREAARSFMDAEANRGVTAKTWNDTLKLLRATFKYLLPSGAINPFSDFRTRDTETVFRKPYSPEDLAAIINAARTDEFTRPLLVTGICSAMRRGDCCLLKWKDVNLQQRFITVKTAKTGQTVDIPIFPMLFDELKIAKKRSNQDDIFVFPAQAMMYQKNPDGITWRVRKILAAAGFQDAEEDGSSNNKTTDKHKTKSLPSYTDQSGKAESVRGKLHVTRTEGLRRASIRDFHSFRVTWVTLALTAGVPLELVQKVTGHKTAEIVLTHYFQPGREVFRQALQSAMPLLLTNGEKSPKDQIQDILATMTEKTWEGDKARIEDLISRL